MSFSLSKMQRHELRLITEDKVSLAEDIADACVREIFNRTTREELQCDIFRYALLSSLEKRIRDTVGSIQLSSDSTPRPTTPKLRARFNDSPVTGTLTIEPIALDQEALAEIVAAAASKKQPGDDDDPEQAPIDRITAYKKRLQEFRDNSKRNASRMLLRFPPTSNPSTSAPSTSTATPPSSAAHAVPAPPTSTAAQPAQVDTDEDSDVEVVRYRAARGLSPSRSFTEALAAAESSSQGQKRKRDDSDSGDNAESSRSRPHHPKRVSFGPTEHTGSATPPERVPAPAGTTVRRFTPSPDPSIAPGPSFQREKRKRDDTDDDSGDSGDDEASASELPPSKRPKSIKEDKGKRTARRAFGGALTHALTWLSRR